MKYIVDGSIERYKARLVATRYTQTYGIDCLETFALVGKMNTVRVLLLLVANYGWDLQQFDVKNAFFHGEVEEAIYMEIPQGYEDNLVAHIVCKLKKALYGLKQSPRAWFGRFASYDGHGIQAKPRGSYIVYQTFTLRGIHNSIGLC